MQRLMELGYRVEVTAVEGGSFRRGENTVKSWIQE
jgi:hypothetical protein